MAFVSNVTLGQTSDYAIWSGFRDAIAPGQRMRDAPPPSPPPRYLTAPVVIAPGQAREVTLGDEIPGWGRVREITATDIVVEQRVSEVEQERLRQSGKAVYQILEYRLPRADAGGQQQLSSRPAPRPSHQLQLPSR